MRILLFGATGMVGQGVLRECLLDRDVELIVTIGRSATGIRDTKLREIVREELSTFSDIASDLSGFDACFFCLGVSSSGMSEKEYERVTYGITLAAAGVLSRLNPQMTFVYISGAGTDSSERGRVMWARVKGRTENALQQLPFHAVYLLRPGVILPIHGERSKVRTYRIFYALAGPVLRFARRLAPDRFLTTEIIGKAMLALARYGGSKPVLEAKDIYLTANQHP